MTDSKERFSIIIPTYGRPKQLKECLDAVAGLAYPRDGFEVIVVDDGSKTSLEEIVGAFQRRINVRLLRQDNAGPATARNRGASESSATYLAFTDDDCKPSQHWLTSLEEALDPNPELLVAGRTVNDLPENSYSTASQLIIDFLYSYYNREDAMFIASNNMALSKEQFLKVGGFDTTFPLAAAEDREFCDRYLYKGFKTLYAPEAVVRHAHPLNFSNFLRQHFNYGQGAHKYHKIRASRSQKAMKIEPLEFYTGLLLYPWKTSCHYKPLLSLLIALSQFANAAGYFSARINSSA
ncbi:MAG TPA: glycosyltransferase [Thermodesulfobacteriota bacterium]|nr:glycosyltransferase [Thermodesulfobacteriota bacterium]